MRGGLCRGVEEVLGMRYLGVEGYFCKAVWLLWSSVDAARGSRQNSAGGTRDISSGDDDEFLESGRLPGEVSTER